MNKLLYVSLLVVIIAINTVAAPISKQMVKQFEAFKTKDKFAEDMSIPYPGLSAPTSKGTLVKVVNNTADDFRALAEKDETTDQQYRYAIKSNLKKLQPIYLELDTEDREMVCHYMEELMDIVGLESSEGILNTFLYGEDISKW